MGSTMSTEEIYKIAMIVLACVLGVISIILIITCCYCCHYKRKLKGGGTRYVKSVKSYRDSTQYLATPYEGWGASVQGRSCGCQSTSSCSRCQSTASAYDWMPSSRDGIVMAPARTALPNPYSMQSSTPSANQGLYGRVLLNSPINSCTKPALPSTPASGLCGTGGNCTYMMTSQPNQTSSQNNAACSNAQFVLESCPKPF